MKSKSNNKINNNINRKTNMTIKRVLSVLVCLTVLITMTFTVTGCGQGGESSEKPGTVVNETKKVITIVDQAQREVTVPKNVKSTAFCYRVICRFILSLGKGDTIKGMGKTEKFLDMVQPSLKNAKDVGQGVVDIEAMAELDPDLFIHKSNDLDTLEAVEKLGIPSVGVTVETPEDMITALDIMGKVLGAEKKAAKLIDYYDRKLKEDRKLVSAVKEKKSAIVIGSALGKVANGSMLQGFMIEEAGGINPAAEIETKETWPAAGAEQIFDWDPDYIFISGSEGSNYSKEDIVDDKTWSEVKAVKNKNVYYMPTVEDSWEFPGVVSVLGIDFMIHKMYPELLSKKQLDANIDEFYTLSYGRKFTKKELGYRE